MSDCFEKIAGCFFVAVVLLSAAELGAADNKKQTVVRSQVEIEAEILRNKEAEIWKQLQKNVVKTEDAVIKEAELIKSRNNKIWNSKKTEVKKARLQANNEMVLAVEKAKAAAAAEKVKANAAEVSKKSLEQELAKVKAAAAAEKAKAAAAEQELAKFKELAENEKIEQKSANIETAEAKAASVTSTETDDGENIFCKIGSNILWYIPQRLSDLMDIVTVEAGVGEIGAEFLLTRYAAFGAGIGQGYMLGWSVNDQHGVYWQRGWYGSFLNHRSFDIFRKTVCGRYVDLYGDGSGKIDAKRMKIEKAEDPYAIGVKVGCYFSLNFQFHPTELVDFLSGIFCLDIKDDDKTDFHWVF
ncbi:MAG: hypothetical protein E7042_06940 [Lentisphaerae bacterium]|nr:hypothetical protein [Lentisphaerota bacterium]